MTDRRPLDPTSVECPKCGAAPGAECAFPSHAHRPLTGIHSHRWEAARLRPRPSPAHTPTLEAQAEAVGRVLFEKFGAGIGDARVWTEHGRDILKAAAAAAGWEYAWNWVSFPYPEPMAFNDDADGAQRAAELERITAQVAPAAMFRRTRAAPAGQWEQVTTG